MSLFPAEARPARSAITAAAQWRSGLTRSVAVVRRSRTPEPPDPLTLDHRLDAAIALRVLATHGQAMAFVSTASGRTGVVSAEDLRFAADWAGPRATVAHAVTQALVDLHVNESTNPTQTHIEEP